MINLGSIKKEIEKDDVDIMYCHTDFQAADVFTKALSPMKWNNALALLGTVSSESQAFVYSAKLNLRLDEGSLPEKRHDSSSFLR